MILDFGDLKIRVDKVDEERTASKHTGKSLILLQVKTSTYGKKENNFFLDIIKKTKGKNIISINEEGNLTKKWKITNSSWSYRENRSVYHHTLKLEEVEEIELDYLSIDDFNIRPYEYKEEIDHEGLRIEAKVLVSEKEFDQLKEKLFADKGLAVIRHGINETPINMRFGLTYWSKHENKYKHEIYLIEESTYLQPNRLNSSFQWIRNVRNYVARQQITIDELLKILELKNILDIEDIETIRKTSRDNALLARCNFDDFDDIDKN